MLKKEKGLKVYRHGDDFVTLGARKDLAWFHTELGKEMIAKITKALTSLPFAAIDKLRFWGATEKFVKTDHAFFADLVAMKKMAAKMKKKKK